MTQQAEARGHWFHRRSRSRGVLDTFKLTCWADEREICCLGGFDFCMSSQTPGNLSKTCTAEGWTEMHPFDIAVNCGYNLNGTGDDVSTPPLSIRGSIADTQWSNCEWTLWHSAKPAREPVGRKNLIRSSFSSQWGDVGGAIRKIALLIVGFTTHTCSMPAFSCFSYCL